MPRFRFALCSATVCSLLLALGCGSKSTGSATVDPIRLRVFKPLPDALPDKPGGARIERVALGRMLYHDPRLSRSQTVSCNTCHKLDAYGVDNQATSTGFRQQHGDRNSPTVYNSAAHFVQFWDGRAPDVEAQAKGPILNPVEMAMASDKQVVAVLKSMPEYVDAFKKAYPQAKDPVTFDNAADSIGAFERTLLTPARWDKFLKGDASALTAQEKAGFNAYYDAGCVTCHAGTLLGGNLYQRLGNVKPYPDASDPGRYKVTQEEFDKMVFKVPSLRNVAKTAPYFHNGKVGKLDDAIAQMAEYQLGKQLTPTEISSIATFLQSLTGQIPAGVTQPPTLPASTPKTPKPEA